MDLDDDLIAIVDTIKKIKSDFRKKQPGSGHLREPVPLEPAGVPMSSRDTDMLHKFACSHPAYLDWQDADLAGVPCRIYQADINQYWLDSTKHDASCQSFYPTWLLSAYSLSAILDALKFYEIIDVGSGDGRVAYCAGLAGLRACGLEIDGSLVDLQRQIAVATGVAFDAIRADALLFDYATLDLKCPAFVISGLPEMGGEMLAEGVMTALSLDSILKEKACFVLLGKTGRDQDVYGWGSTIAKFDLVIDDIIWLPTYWTAEQERDTPHILTRFST